MNSPQAIKEQLEREAIERGFRILRLDQIVCQNTARNVALKYANTEYIIFADNDVLLSNGWLDHLIDCADKTGAALVGPLYMEGPRERGIVHMAGGDVHIRVTEKGNYLVQSYIHARDHLGIVDSIILRRRPTELLEFHCALIRKSLFDKVGSLDEKLPAVGDHDDLCIRALQAGEKVYFEPAAVVHYEYSEPLLWCDMFYFFMRWGANWANLSIQHFASKYNLAKDDPWRKSIARWMKKHRKDLPLPPMGGRIITAIVRTAFELVSDLSSPRTPSKVSETIDPDMKQRQPEPSPALR